MSWRPDARRGAWVLLLAAGLVAGKVAPAQDGAQPVRFTAPDGTRFLLLPAPGRALVHWAVATPCGPRYDPPAAPGLAAACVAVSLAGTWTTGSRDAAREAEARLSLDTAEADLAAAPRTGDAPPEPLQKRVEELRAAVASLCDPFAFRRVMLAAPATGVALDLRDDVAVLAFTTTPSAVPAVAALLRERREQQALRGVRAEYARQRERAIAAWDADPLSPLRAEALALAYPGSAFAHAGDRPPDGGFTRALALRTWARTQHPAATVHVLTGDFDAASLETTLRAVFTATALPAPPPVEPARPREPVAIRRAIVPGARQPALVIAWPLRGDEDPTALGVLASWFGVGPDSWLGRALQRRGRRDVLCHARAPWPEGADAGLFEIEVIDRAGGAPGLAEQVLALCRAGTRKQPLAGELEQQHGLVLAEFERQSRHGTAFAALIARQLVRAPGLPLRLQPPLALAREGLPAGLQRILDGNPIVVEWRSP